MSSRRRIFDVALKTSRVTLQEGVKERAGRRASMAAIELYGFGRRKPRAERIFRFYVSRGSRVSLLVAYTTQISLRTP
jgi:hypothetical protein